MEILRVGIRTGLILVFAGLIVAVTSEFTPTSMGAPTAAKAISRVTQSGEEATPGSEYALGHLILDIQRGRPILVPMESALAASVQRSLPRDRPVEEPWAAAIDSLWRLGLRK